MTKKLTSIRLTYEGSTGMITEDLPANGGIVLFTMPASDCRIQATFKDSPGEDPEPTDPTSGITFLGDSASYVTYFLNDDTNGIIPGYEPREQVRKEVSQHSEVTIKAKTEWVFVCLYVGCLEDGEYKWKKHVLNATYTNLTNVPSKIRDLEEKGTTATENIFDDGETFSVNEEIGEFVWTFTMPEKDIAVCLDVRAPFFVDREGECIELGLKNTSEGTEKWFGTEINHRYHVDDTVLARIARGYAGKHLYCEDASLSWDDDGGYYSFTISAELYYDRLSTTITLVDGEECEDLPRMYVRTLDSGLIAKSTMEDDTKWNSYGGPYYAGDVIQLKPERGFDKTKYKIVNPHVSLIDEDDNILNENFATPAPVQGRASEYEFTVPSPTGYEGHELFEMHVFADTEVNDGIHKITFIGGTSGMLWMYPDCAAFMGDGSNEYYCQEGGQVKFRFKAANSADVLCYVLDGSGNINTGYSGAYHIRDIKIGDSQTMNPGDGPDQYKFSDNVCEFTMPDQDVTIHVYVKSDRCLLKFGFQKYDFLEYGSPLAYITSITRNGVTHTVEGTYAGNGYFGIKNGDEVYFTVEAYRPSYIQQYVQASGLRIGRSETSGVVYDIEAVGNTEGDIFNIDSSYRPEYSRGKIYAYFKCKVRDIEEGSTGLIEITVLYDLPKLNLHITPHTYHNTEIYFKTFLLDNFTIPIRVVNGTIEGQPSTITLTTPSAFSSIWQNETRTFPHEDYLTCYDAEGYSNYVPSRDAAIQLPTTDWYFEGPMNFFYDCDGEEKIPDEKVKNIDDVNGVEYTDGRFVIGQGANLSDILILEYRYSQGTKDGWMYYIVDTGAVTDSIPEVLTDNEYYLPVLNVKPKTTLMRIEITEDDGCGWIEMLRNYPSGTDIKDRFKCDRDKLEIDMDLNSDTMLLFMRCSGGELISVNVDVFDISERESQNPTSLSGLSESDPRYARVQEILSENSPETLAAIKANYYKLLHTNKVGDEKFIVSYHPMFAKLYKIFVGFAENGLATVTNSPLQEGDTCNISLRPDEGFHSIGPNYWAGHKGDEDCDLIVYKFDENTDTYVRITDTEELDSLAINFSESDMTFRVPPFHIRIDYRFRLESD